MTGLCSGPKLCCDKHLRIHRSLRVASFMTLGASLVLFLIQTIPIQAQQARLSGADVCSQAYLDSLPQPVPMNGSHRVMQMVNCSGQTLLGAANSAHRQGELGFPAFPREGTWVMQPYGTPGTPDNPYPNVLTIDIPQQWERTGCPKNKCPKGGPVGPNLWARTGCRYDIATNRAQCETGTCADQYDCSSTAFSQAGFTTISEWTFYQDSNDPSIFIDDPDISLVNGGNLTVDLQPVGGQQATCPAGPLKGQAKCNPLAGQDTDQMWLMYNYPLSVHAADLRLEDPNGNFPYCTDANGISGFAIKRSDIDKTKTFAFVIEDENGNPTMPPGDNPLACLSNCGKQEFDGPPAAGCDPNDPNDPKCYPWLVFCAGDGNLYNQPCRTDADCVVNGQPNVHAACWYNTPSQQMMGVCSLRGFYKGGYQGCPIGLIDFLNPPPGSPASDVACTFTYGSLNLLDTHKGTQLTFGAQPPTGGCADVRRADGTLVPCVGDDTIHQIFHGAYTWPNDPEVFDGDSPLYRMIFAPGGTSVPITEAQVVPLCSNLPANYDYPDNANLCAGPLLNEGAVFGIARDKKQKWSCALDQPGSASNGILCRWHPAPTTDSGCSPPLTDQNVTNSTCGVVASGTSLVSGSFKPNNNDPLFFEVAIATPDPTMPVNPPINISGCVPSSGPGSWSLVSSGSLSFGSQTNHDQGYIAWYSGTSNNDGQSGSQCKVTVTLAESAAATLKVYDVPGYNGTVETTSMSSGSFDPRRPSQPTVSAQPLLVLPRTSHANDLMLGSLLQVNQQPTPITWWENWLSNSLDYFQSINCQSHFCPADDGTDYLSGHGPYSSNADAGHRAVGPGPHALQRAANTSTKFDWGGVAIYIELASAPLALGCPSSTAQVSVPYASQVVPTGGSPEYQYTIPGLPPGLVQLDAPGGPYIYGLPKMPGNYQFMPQVIDGTGKHVSTTCTINVSAP